MSNPRTYQSDRIQTFNPNTIALDNGNLLGLPFDYDTADIMVIGVPWEVTVSYRPGTAWGPQRVLDASRQLDIYDFDYPDGWQRGIFMQPIAAEIQQRSDVLRTLAQQILEFLESGGNIEDRADLQEARNEINQACHALNQWLFSQTQPAIAAGRWVGVIGGDHSVPLGYLQALASQYDNFGILHIDAHADLRVAYEGFQFSHASIMDNVLQLPQVTKLVQVGIRDLCHEEIDRIQQSQGRVVMYADPLLKFKRYQGITWQTLCEQIIEQLPAQVYVSFDVDGLDPKLCPNTGTPVPGGLELEETFALFREIIRSGRQIIGFDVCEVGDGEWDANVGARAVYKLCNFMGLPSRICQ
ncbi:agmatinase family protein [Trichothermofontia sp.]